MQELSQCVTACDNCGQTVGVPPRGPERVDVNGLQDNVLRRLTGSTDAKSGALPIDHGFRLIMLAWEGLPVDTREIVFRLARDAAIHDARYEPVMERLIKKY